LKNLEKTNLKDLLKKKNPYLFKAKNLVNVHDLVTSFLDAKLSSSEEKIFGDFLEDLAIFVAKKTLNAMKSTSKGLDFEFEKENRRYLVSVKSGLNWGNSSQWAALENNFKVARKVLAQSPHIHNIEFVLGICYGKASTTYRRGIILQVTGQTFWYLISGDPSFYQKIVQSIGYKAKELNETFENKKVQLIGKFIKIFKIDFCNSNGEILWDKLVEFNSRNLTDIDKARFTKIGVVIT